MATQRETKAARRSAVYRARFAAAAGLRDKADVIAGWLRAEVYRRPDPHAALDDLAAVVAGMNERNARGDC